MIHNLLVALSFLTIIPINSKVKDEGELGNSMSHFPLVGLFLGSLLVIVDYIAGYIFSPLVVSLLVIGILIILTGAIHLDGFADTLDGLGVSGKKEEILSVMRDTMVGVMGIVGVYLLLGFKVLFLYEIPPPLRYKTLLLVPALGRYGMVISSYFTRYPYEEGKGKPFIIGIRKRQLLVSTSVLLVSIVTVLGYRGLILFVMAMILVGGIVRFMNKRIGGMTGDTLGFTCEVIEVAMLSGIVSMKNILA